MKTVRRSILAAALAASVVLAFGAAPASAGKTIKTSVDLRYEGTFESMVTSPSKKCEVRRQVTIFEVRGGEDKRLESKRTSKDGNNVSFSDSKFHKSRRYYTRVSARDIGSKVCASAKSPRVSPK